MSPDAISLLVLDVDGVLTDGRIVLDGAGNEIKRFHVRDGSAVTFWQRAGGRVAILSGRRSDTVSRRAAELGIEIVEQAANDKLAGYERVLARAGARDEQTCYVGDDLLDLAPMRRCGYPVAVADAADEIKRIAAYVTQRPGGHGAVREIVEHLLKRQGQWARILALYEQQAAP